MFVHLFREEHNDDDWIDSEDVIAIYIQYLRKGQVPTGESECFKVRIIFATGDSKEAVYTRFSTREEARTFVKPLIDAKRGINTE